jgi:hypothetical protein
VVINTSAVVAPTAQPALPFAPNPSLPAMMRAGLTCSGAHVRARPPQDQQSFLAAFDQEPEIRLAGVAHITAVEMGAMRPVPSCDTSTLLIDAFTQLGAVTESGAGAVAVVEEAGAPDGAEGQLRWFVGAETLNQCADAQSLYQNLSCSTGVVLRELLDKHGEEAAGRRGFLPVICSPSTPLRELVHRVVRAQAPRLWVVDDGGRPIGMVSLGMIIQVIMKKE